MIIEELNHLLSEELELIKEKSIFENMYISNLKKIELTKENIVAKNKEDAKAAITKRRDQEIEKAKKKIQEDNLLTEERLKKIEQNFIGKKDMLLERFLDELRKEVENAYT
ncbi:MAG: hypothetical protein KKF44_10240 [Nanoarchaeota archaeon]|nr:hypothetical protein [Nanoarchaeota archaeon]